ncbi:hypothetical protein GCM10009665_15510 [Kitasatospora nipponensis]|uniref:Uncharacterized protein n=1 Tax=Kitasatospora nipponensis TaxID=258049 RepID=A0ABP4GI68_9ACTN
MRCTQGVRGILTGTRPAALVASAVLATAVGASGQGARAAAPAGAPATTATRSAPVQPCPTQPVEPNPPAAATPAATVPVPAPVDLPASSAAFGAGYPGNARYLVGPGDWTCDAVYFAGDGGEQAYLHPAPAESDPVGARFASLVQAVFDSGGAQTDVDLACPFIAQATAPTTPGGQPATCLAPPPQSADQVHPVATGTPGLHVAAVGVPSGVREPNIAASGQSPPAGPSRPVVALVTLQGPQGTAQEISCAMTGSTAVESCQASLGYFLATSAVGGQLSDTELAGAVADLDAFVAAFLG